METWDFQGSETTLNKTVMINTSREIFAEVHGMYNRWP